MGGWGDDGSGGGTRTGRQRHATATTLRPPMAVKKRDTQQLLLRCLVVRWASEQQQPAG